MSNEKNEYLRLCNDIKKIKLELMELRAEKENGSCFSPPMERYCMETFLCENCGEAVLVPVMQITGKIHWKCMVCYQENNFDVQD